MALHTGFRKLIRITAQDAGGHVVPLESPELTDHNLELSPGPEENTYYVRQSSAYDGEVGLQVPFVFTADGRAGDGTFLVAVDFGTETLFPGDATIVTGTVGEEEPEQVAEPA